MIAGDHTWIIPTTKILGDRAKNIGGSSPMKSAPMDGCLEMIGWQITDVVYT